MFEPLEYPPKLEYPKFHWRWEFWLTFISYLFIIWAPELTIKIILFLIPIIVPTVFWFAKVMLIIIKRARFYPQAYRHLQFVNQNLRDLQKEFAEVVLKGKAESILEISRAAYLKGNLYLTLLKFKGITLNVGDEVTVIDKQDIKLMGVFEITQLRKNEYYAKGVKEVDRLWLGFVQQNGEVNTFPDLVAIISHKDAFDG